MTAKHILYFMIWNSCTYMQTVFRISVASRASDNHRTGKPGKSISYMYVNPFVEAGRMAQS